MPATIIKNQQNSERKSTKVVTNHVESSMSNIERKTREMEKVLDKFPVSAKRKE